MKNRAFSLIELIFVIIIIGVLSGISFYISQPEYTHQDAQYTLLKLKEARYNAIGYDGLKDDQCVILTKESLSSAESPAHTIKSTIELGSVSTSANPILHSIANATVCFDALGRVHEGKDITLLSLVQSNSDIQFKNGDKNSTIRLFSGSGYAIIQSCNN